MAKSCHCSLSHGDGQYAFGRAPDACLSVRNVFERGQDTKAVKKRRYSCESKRIIIIKKIIRTNTHFNSKQNKSKNKQEMGEQKIDT